MPERPEVPWIIQDAFPGYHGVAWYWKEFDAPANPSTDGRTLLRFWQVDYKADVWLNDTQRRIARGGRVAVRPRRDRESSSRAQKNRLAVRVLNPTHQPIDGIVLNETPHRNKALPYTSGNAWDQGGICDSVELLLVPAVRVDDLYVRPDWKTGPIRVQANIRNAGPGPVKGNLLLTVAPAATGETLVSQPAWSASSRPATRSSRRRLQVDQPRLWNLDDPFLYRVTAQVGSRQSLGSAGSRAPSTSSPSAAASATSASTTARSGSTASGSTCDARTRATAARSAWRCRTIPTTCGAI